MQSLNIFQNILYRFHLLLNVKNKYLLITLLQILFVLYLTNIYDCTYCMTTDGDNQSEVSDIFEYNEDYFDDQFSQAFDMTKNRAYAAFNPVPDDQINNAIGPMYEHYKSVYGQPMNELSPIDKIKLLEEDYFESCGKTMILENALVDQGDQLSRRHESLLSAKRTIKEITQENLELKNEIDKLQRQLSEILRK